jgi:hypothetical protein
LSHPTAWRMTLVRVTDLLASLDGLGAMVVVRPDGTTGLQLPADPYSREQALKLVPLLKENRAAILKHFEAMEAGHDDGIISGDNHPGKRCHECNACVFTDDPVEVARCCPLVLCPLRIPDGTEQQRRNRKQWARRDGNDG